MVGTTALPDCLADETAILRHLSWVEFRFMVLFGTSVYDVINGCIAETPSIVASRIT